jgi:hypothetical protein
MGTCLFASMVAASAIGKTGAAFAVSLFAEGVAGVAAGFAFSVLLLQENKTAMVKTKKQFFMLGYNEDY